MFRGVYDDGKEKLPVAIKTINLDLTTQNLEQLQQETRLLATCHHPNICGLYQAMVHQQFLWLVMPELKLSVLDLMRQLQPNGFEEQIIATIMHDILQAIHYLHANKQIHRDIKLSNFLLDGAGTSYLSDFGVASFIRPFSNAIKCTFVGSPLYMAPEVAENKPYDNSCDVWSFGICLYHLATGQLPHENQPGFEALLKVIQQDSPRLPARRNYSKQFRELVEFCLQKQPRDRKTAEQLLQLKFWQKKADRSRIADMINEYCMMRQNKQGLYQDKVDQANMILHNKVQKKLDQEWQFDSSDEDSQPLQVGGAQEALITPTACAGRRKRGRGDGDDGHPCGNPPHGRRAQSEQKLTPQTNPDRAASMETSPQEKSVTQSSDTAAGAYDNVVGQVQLMIEELRQLRAENQKLRDENARYKDRLKMFMNAENKD